MSAPSNRRLGLHSTKSKLRGLSFFLSALCAFSSHASFIESSMGAAVVNDATAVYYNPAALMLVKRLEAIALGSTGHTQSEFKGQSTFLASNYIQKGVANSQMDYSLPSFYLGAPVIKEKLVLGIAMVANDFNKDADGHSILRYAQSNNTVEDMDIVGALGFQCNKYLSIGFNINSSRAHFLLKPISGLPSLHIPDSQSINDSKSHGLGGDLGLLLKVKPGLVVGVNYRQAVTYRMQGSSTFYGSTTIVSHDYYFKYWTPARTVVSINHFLTKKLGWIGTWQFIEWSIFKEATIHNIATRAGVLPQAKVAYYFNDSPLVTLGLHYHPSSKWVLRAAGSYTKSPSSGRFQIDNGDSLTLGGALGYTFFKKWVIDVSFAHAFLMKTDIHARNAQNLTQGTTEGSVNAVALKCTVRV